MERLDKVVGEQTEYSRKDIKKLVSSKKVYLNGNLVLKSDIKVDINVDKITIDGKDLVYQKNVYLVLNKPAGYISATEDRSQKTVLDLIDEKYLCREMFPAGRLDKDTTGMMIITDDGVFAHNILSPKKHIKKIYEVTLDIPVSLLNVNLKATAAKAIIAIIEIIKTIVLDVPFFIIPPNLKSFYHTVLNYTRLILLLSTIFFKFSKITSETKILPHGFSTPLSITEIKVIAFSLE